MDITINGNEIPSNNSMTMLTFNHIPTILSVKGSVGSGYSFYTLTINSPSTTINGSEYVKFGNSTLTPTNNIDEAVNTIFYIPNSITSQSKRLIAYYLAKALNCTSESASYNIYSENDKVYIYSKEIGKSLDEISTNISNFYNITNNNNVTQGELDNTKIIVNVFNENNYITTLTKECINSECKFDLSPILTVNTKDGENFKYGLKINKLNNIDNYEIADVVGLNALNGYSVNQGKFYMNNSDTVNGWVLLQNIKRGDAKITNNNTILYTSSNIIDLTLFHMSSGGIPSSVTLTVKYIDSILNELGQQPINITTNDRQYVPLHLELNEESFNKSTYIDIVLPTDEIIRYNIIKPLKYSDTTNRVYWYNSYGGVSFFDFTGSKTEERKTEKTTYKKSNLSLYDDKQISLDKVYSNALEYEVTLKTHMIEQDGIYPLYDLLNSYHAWIVVNGEENEIIITDLKINETQNTNIYQGEITYTYSSNDMF